MTVEQPHRLAHRLRQHLDARSTTRSPGQFVAAVIGVVFLLVGIGGSSPA